MFTQIRHWHSRISSVSKVFIKIIVQKKRIGLPQETLSGIPSSRFQVLLYPVGIKTERPPFTSCTAPNYTGVLSSLSLSPVCCPFWSFMGLLQLVSNQPLITQPISNRPQLVLAGDPVETWHIQQTEPSPSDVPAVRTYWTYLLYATIYVRYRSKYLEHLLI